METQHRLEQAARLHPHSRYLIAFLLGLPVGFLFRPFYTSNASLISSVPSTPPLLTLWNLWQIPVLLLWGLMLFRAIRSFKAQKDIRTPGRFILTGMTLLLALPALLYGIAPLDQLQWMHLYLNLTGFWYPCFNPFAVGLAVAFILHKNDQRTSSFGKGPLLAIVAWAGTAILFLMVVEAYIHLVSSLCFHWTCQSGMIPNLAPFWIPIGLLIAAIGGSIGGGLAHTLLTIPSYDEGDDQS